MTPIFHTCSLCGNLWQFKDHADGFPGGIRFMCKGKVVSACHDCIVKAGKRDEDIITKLEAIADAKN